MGPAALRTAGLVRSLEQLGRVVRDHGDLGITRDAGALPPKGCAISRLWLDPAPPAGPLRPAFHRP
jgi:hypothetical protein